MSAAGVHESLPAMRRERLWWLPANGIGNGLDDDAWVPILDIVDDEELAHCLLNVAAEAGVAAYVAPLLGRHRGTRRVWVGAHGYGTVECRLITVLPALVAARGVDHVLR